NGNHESIAALIAGLLEMRSEAEVVIFPPYVYIPVVVAEIEGTDISVGAQNISEHYSGAFTGEVSGEMLREVGCRYVIVGHSERRSIYGETNQQVAEKFSAAQAGGLIPVLCVGETLEQREQGGTLDVIAAQVDAVINASGLDAICNAVIAYEPVWAIGTGKTASAEQAQVVHQAIRQQLGDSGARTRLLYGGSVKASNAAELFSQPDVDGALVGGASLDAKEFNEICKLA
ncbi:MAG TPA: triose-phosphate isomerase, partial [Porticoccus sp.]|nr:triose-phosphate isomerase [Porticoccus sp.]